MIPTPHMSDVFMDLMADSTEFLDGKAHRGMALGSNNIYEKCNETIVKGKLSRPFYKLAFYRGRKLLKLSYLLH